MESLARIFVVSSVLDLFMIGSVAHAMEPCRAPAIEADAGVRAHWPDLVESLASELRSRTDLDACVAVKVTFSDAFHIEVMLSDGRSTERVVARVEDVVPVLEALLFLPQPRPQPPPPADAPATEPAEPPPLVSPTPSTVTSRDVAEPTKRRGKIGLELSALGGVRVGNGSNAAGVGALSFLDVDGWLIGVGFRSDRYDSSALVLTANEVAVLGGHRFRWTDVSLDLVAGPGVVVVAPGDAAANRNIVARGTEPPPAPNVSSARPRILGGARVSFFARSPLRLFVGVDAEVGPGGSGGPDDTDPMPSATIGLALGVTAGTR